jgi:hypothetical protein
MIGSRAPQSATKGSQMTRAALSLFALVAAAIGGALAGAQPTEAAGTQAAPKKQEVVLGF